MFEEALILTILAAQVCTRFQANALACFPVRMCLHQDSNFKDDHSAMERVRSLLSLFGHEIQSMTITKGNTESKHIHELFNSISEFCGKTLTELTVHNINVDFNTRARFKALKDLSIFNSTIQNFELHSPLKKLTIQSNNAPRNVDNWFIRSFPMLEEASFSSVYEVTNDMLISFMALNPQLQSLEVIKCHKVGTVSQVKKKFARKSHQSEFGKDLRCGNQRCN